MNEIIKDVRQELEANKDLKTFETSQRYFKERIKFYGVRVSTVSQLSKVFFESLKNSTKKEIFGLCTILWSSGYIEESFIACNWSYFLNKDYEPDDFSVFENWLHKYVNNWASCDTLCNHTIGTFIEMYPDYIQRLKGFTTSPNRWVRRAAAVSLIIPAKKGKFPGDIMQVASILLCDTDDLVQKGYGWLLKEASVKHQQEVFGFVMKNKKVMPRTALRYAIEKMPLELKKMAMEK